MKPDQYYVGHRKNGLLHGFVRDNSPSTLSLSNITEAYLVTCREAREGDAPSPYWGFEHKNPTQAARWTMIWPSKFQLNMCFPGGVDHAESLGLGRAVNLIVELA